MKAKTKMPRSKRRRNLIPLKSIMSAEEHRLYDLESLHEAVSNLQRLTSLLVAEAKEAMRHRKGRRGL